MSTELLERVKQHIIDDGGLLGAYAVKKYKWSDADLAGSASIALFRMSGTGGRSDHQQQQPDVSLFLLASPALKVQADNDMLAVLRYLRADFSSANVFAFYPLQSYKGPSDLENGRVIFEMVIRCGVEDH
jgi:hypothetical protein